MMGMYQNPLLYGSKWVGIWASHRRQPRFGCTVVSVKLVKEWNSIETNLAFGLIACGQYWIFAALLSPLPGLKAVLDIH